MEKLGVISRVNEPTEWCIGGRCSGRPQGNENWSRLNTSFHSPEDDQSIWSKRRKLSSYQVESREPCNLSSFTMIAITSRKLGLDAHFPYMEII